MKQMLAHFQLRGGWPKEVHVEKLVRDLEKGQVRPRAARKPRPEEVIALDDGEFGKF